MNVKIKNNKDLLLKNALDHCFFVGVNDSGAELCKANSIYGIAGIHYVQKQLGIKSDATFMSTPDMTITRNKVRWGSGFGYGGKITWGSGSDELVILNIKPNACGMLVGGLNELPSSKSLIQKLHKMESSVFKIGDIPVKWDFYKSNHFIDLFIVKPVMKTRKKLPPYAFIIHGSVPEFSGDNEHGFGLYYDFSQELMKMAEKIKTPFQDFYILTGDNAKKYHEMYQYAEKFAKRKRKLAAELLFGDYTEICNETHQGLTHMNEIKLGCHNVENFSKIYPLALKADLPAYLVKGQPSLSEECIDMLGFEKRAKRLNVYNRLNNLNLLPHGGGYNLPDILSVNKVIEINRKRYYEVEMLNDRGKKIVSEVKELPFEYRGRKVVLRSMELGLFEIVAKLIPQYILKI